MEAAAAQAAVAEREAAIQEEARAALNLASELVAAQQQLTAAEARIQELESAQRSVDAEVCVCVWWGGLCRWRWWCVWWWRVEGGKERGEQPAGALLAAEPGWSCLFHAQKLCLRLVCAPHGHHRRCVRRPWLHRWVPCRLAACLPWFLCVPGRCSWTLRAFRRVRSRPSWWAG